MSEPILMIDDNLMVLKSIQGCLGRQFDFLVATNAEQAEAAMQTFCFKVILTDFKMPGKNGLVVLEHARKLQPAAIRMVLSGYSDVLAMTDLLAAMGVSQILLKPCSPAQLSAALKSAVHQYDAAASQATLVG